MEPELRSPQWKIRLKHQPGKLTDMGFRAYVLSLGGKQVFSGHYFMTILSMVGRETKAGGWEREMLVPVC